MNAKNSTFTTEHSLNLSMPKIKNKKIQLVYIKNKNKNKNPLIIYLQLGGSLTTGPTSD